MSVKGSSRVRAYLVFWLFVLSAVAFLDRVNISIAGGEISSEFHLGKVELGWVFSAFLVGYALFQTVGGRLADRYGSRRVLAGGVIWWGVFTAATALVPNGLAFSLSLLVATRFLLGAGEAVIYPASNQFVSRWIPVKERGIANGWIFAGVGAGAGLTPPIVTYIVIHYGWRASFWFCACIGVIAGLIWYLIARDLPEQHPMVSSSELETIHADFGSDHVEPLAESGSAIVPAKVLIPWKIVLRSKEVLAVTFSYFCYGYIAWIFFSWFYIYLAEVRGLNLKASAGFAMLPFIAMAVACAVGGWINDRLSATRGIRVGRCGLGVVSMLLTAGFLAVGSTVANPQLASVVLAGGAGSLYLSQSSFWSVTADIAGSSSGSVSGFMNMGAQIGGAVTATLTPVIATHFNWTASFLVAAALSVLGGLAWLIVDPTRKLVPDLS